MDSSDSANPRPASKEPAPHSTAEPEGAGAAHDFEAQKRIHQQIRNDPDYDDWEYGTEPLPHEAWSAGRKGNAPSPPAGGTA